MHTINIPLFTEPCSRSLLFWAGNLIYGRHPSVTIKKRLLHFFLNGKKRLLHKTPHLLTFSFRLQLKEVNNIISLAYISSKQVTYSRNCCHFSFCLVWFGSNLIWIFKFVWHILFGSKNLTTKVRRNTTKNY